MNTVFGHKSIYRHTYGLERKNLIYNETGFHYFYSSHGNDIISISEEVYKEKTSCLENYKHVLNCFGEKEILSEYYKKMLREIEKYCEVNFKNFSLELNIYTISRELYITNKELHENYKLQRYELYIKVNGTDCNEQTFSLYEFWDDFLNNINLYQYIYKEKIDLLRRKVNKRFSPIKIKDGCYPCVLSSSFAAIVIHESIGHLAEEDIYNKYLKNNCDNFAEFKEKLLIYDFAQYDNNHYSILPCPLLYDDIGEVCQDILIYENDRFKAILSSGGAGYKKTGNIRMGDSDFKPLIRMRNTGLLAGDDSLEEMISSIDFGYYLDIPDIGCVLPNSTFEISVLSAYEIKNGKITRPTENIFVHSRTADFLSSIDMIGNNMSWMGSRCFKKNDEVYVGIGAPSIKSILSFSHQSVFGNIYK